MNRCHERAPLPDLSIDTREDQVNVGVKARAGRLLAATLAAFMQSEATAAERSEPAAREYMYCSHVVLTWEMVFERKGMTDMARGLRIMYSGFLIAAVLRSDGEFVGQQLPNSLQRFKRRFPGQDAPTENRDFEAEGERCASLWKFEVRPLLEPGPPRKDSRVGSSSTSFHEGQALGAARRALPR